MEIIPLNTDANPLTVQTKGNALVDEFLQKFSKPRGKLGPTINPLKKENIITTNILTH